MPDHDDLVDAWRSLAPGFRHRRDEAEDYLQDAVVAALDERRRTGNTPAVARAWLRTVARRREVDHVRRAQCERRIAQAYAEELDSDVAQEVLDRHEASWLAGHVKDLPAKTRAVVFALAAGRTQSDVATELDLTPRAVEAHVRRARIALRRVLDRAGTVVPFGFLQRRWRRLLPIGAAGVAAAVGVAMMNGPGTAMLLPIPQPKPQVRQDRDDTRPPGGIAFTGPLGTAALAPQAPYAGAGTGRPDRTRAKSGAEPTPTAAPTGPNPVEPPDILLADSYGPGTTGDHAVSRTPTVEGAWYEVTVSGAYSYNGRDWLADCGHYQPETKNHVWEPYASLLMDDAVAPCIDQPLDPTHVYTWRFLGTGRPVTFYIQDAGGSVDNVGQLVISVQRVKTG